jgi:outer membrane protein assembly factor BamB
MKYISILALFILIISGCSKQPNWNQYLGPNRNAKINGTEIQRSWPENGPVKMWEFPLGPGYGGSAIFDEEVFILDRIQGVSDVLRCIDLNSGEEKWNFSYSAEGEISYPGSRTVPFVDEDFVWTVGPHGHFYCIDKKTQKEVWFHNIKDEFEAVPSSWGFSQSPLVYNDLVIVAPQGKKAGVVAFNKFSGELVWKSRPLTGYNFHVSPTLGNYGGIDQVIMISPYSKEDSTQTNEVLGLDVNTGEELWKYEGLKSFATITPPTVIDENRLFLTDCSYNDNYSPISILLEITKNENGFQLTEIFKTEDFGSKMHPPVIFGKHIYVNNSGRPNQLTCATMDGKPVWETGTSGNFEMGGLILVDGLIIAQNGKNGDIHLIEPSPDGYKEIGKASFFDSSKSQAWAPLAFASGKLVVRDMEKMVCMSLQ